MTAYDKLPGLNYSTLKLALTSPRAYARRGYQRDRKALRFGSAFHCVVFEPARFATEYAINPHNGSTKAGKAFTADALAAGKTLVSEADYDVMFECGRALHEHPECRAQLESVFATEQAITATIEGHLCKGRVDAFSETRTLLGLKTCASLRSFEWDATRLVYPMQWALYDSILIANGEPAERVVELVVEKNEPFDCACYVVTDAVLELGRSQYRRAMRIVDECTARNTWPGMHPGETLLVLPDRAYDQPHPDDEEVFDDE